MRAAAGQRPSNEQLFLDIVREFKRVNARLAAAAYPVLEEILGRFDEIALPDSWLVAGGIAQTIWNWVADDLRSSASKTSTSYISMTKICRSTPKPVMRDACVNYFEGSQ